jgi:hypothetical protein
MNDTATKAGGVNMTNSNGNGLLHIEKRTAVAVGAGVLIALGLALQWIEVLFTRFVAQNSWLFATIFGQAWNMITVWL